MNTKNEIDIKTLKKLYSEPRPTSIAKVQYQIDEYSEEYISKSPFLILGTEGDVSPKGDFPGFVKVIDKKTICIPDRSGNNRLDSYINILSNPTVAIMFFIPGISETLRIRGTAEITDNKKLLETMSIKSVIPKTALIIHIKEIYLHCAKAIVRSGIWDQKNIVKNYSTREMFSSHVGKNIDEFSDYYDKSIRSVIDDEGRK